MSNGTQADPAFDPTPDQPLRVPSAPQAGVDVLALTVAWSRTEPERVGECVFLSPLPTVIGRGGARPEDKGPRAELVATRPGRIEPRPPLTAPNLSRLHARLTLGADGIAFERLGKGPVALDATLCNDGIVTPGSTLLLANELLLLCDRRSSQIPESPLTRLADFAFGHSDDLGITGETPSTWRLRDQVRFAAGSGAPLQIVGPSGAGKDVIARAVHRASAWRDRPFIVLGGATVSRADLEGLQARADAPFVLIDELSDMASELQAQLSRFIALTNNLALPRVRIVATNSIPQGGEPVRPELASRFIVTIRVPGLDERRADVPLMARCIVHDLAQDQPEIGARFFDGWDPAARRGTPRISPTLVDRLVRHRWNAHVRELTSLLWTSMTTATEPWLDATPEVLAQLESSDGSFVDPATLDETAVRRALDLAHGKVAVAARALGLKNRWVLYRLMDKLDIRP